MGRNHYKFNFGNPAIYLLLLTILASCQSPKETKDSSRTPENASLMPVGLATEGKPLFATCAACHGSSGEGNQKLNAPAIANLEDWYSYRQLMNFRKGMRGGTTKDSLGFQMAAMAKVLKDSIAASHIVAYLKTMPAVSIPALIKGDIKKGEQYYQSICGSCHGPRAIGNQKMNAPRLSGLDDWYLERQILNFKKSKRGGDPADLLGAQMVSMVGLLPNQDAVNDVIAYIRSCAQNSPD